MERGALREAERLASRARKVYEKTAGPERAELAEDALGGEHHALIRLMQTLADCYRVRARAREAEALYERARRIADRAYGPRHAAMLPSLSGLALVAQQRGDDARAESLHREALAVAEAALEHLERADPRRAAVLQGLAALYAAQGRGAEAARIERALAPPRGMLSLISPIPPAAER